MEVAKNKGGRPRKHLVGTRRPQLAFRARGGLYEKLKADAQLADRSMSEQVEWTIQRYYETKANEECIAAFFNDIKNFAPKASC